MRRSQGVHQVYQLHESESTQIFYIYIEDTTMRILLHILLCVTVCSVLFAGEPPEISSIREYYSETLKKIKTGALYQRELNLKYPAIPGAGTTASRVRIYYDIPEGRDGMYEYGIIRVENYYQHASRVFYEEYLYNANGELLFYYGRRGTGDIGRPEGIRWHYDERLYFWRENVIRIMRGQETQDRPTAADVKKGSVILKHAQEIRENYCQVTFPAPLVFTAE